LRSAAWSFSDGSFSCFVTSSTSNLVSRTQCDNGIASASVRAIIVGSVLIVLVVSASTRAQCQDFWISTFPPSCHLCLFFHSSISSILLPRVCFVFSSAGSSLSHSLPFTSTCQSRDHVDRASNYPPPHLDGYIHSFLKLSISPVRPSPLRLPKIRLHISNMLFSRIAGVVAFSAVVYAQKNKGGNANTGNNNNAGTAAGGNGATGTTLLANAIQNGSFVDGSAATGSQAGQAASATSQNNFINNCAGKTLTNGLQVQSGSCNGISK
jgi:hypothetical protein